MKNGSKEPDWGKFGLDGEKQPLNPGSTRVEQAKPNSDLYGGQVVDDNELFADDQGSKAQPWWLSHFLVSERVLFGTWDGVFTSCLINIFGVIVFLRSGWIVAEAGIGHAALIVLAAVALILMAVLAAIGICERCHVQSGGVYFLISHVLGSRRGTAVGILYVLGQAIGNALCATGFGESIAGLISETETPNPWVERSVAAFVIIMLTLINLAGVKWVIRLQFVLLAILILGAMDFGIGSFTHTNEELGFHGWNMTVWRNNSKPGYTDNHNWFSVFGVFFPALTGVMAGINMSGDLKNPSQDISIGTLAAVATASLETFSNRKKYQLAMMHNFDHKIDQFSIMDHSIEITVNEEPDASSPTLRRTKTFSRALHQTDSKNLPSLIKINHNTSEENLLGLDDGYRMKLMRTFSLNENEPNRKSSKENDNKKSPSSIRPKPRSSVYQPSSRKLSLITDKNDKITMDFGNAIRSGFTEVVSNMLEIHGPSLMNQLSIQFETEFRKSSNKSVALSKVDKVHMSPFHLAIISQNAEVVNVMLQSAKKTLRTTLGMKTKVFFATSDPNDYNKDDKTMDGINSFHLAGRFHAHSLVIILAYLRDTEQSEVVIDLLEATDQHMGKTPLHMAVKSPSHVHTALLILAGAEVNARDERGYTALHMAAKEGNEPVIKVLLEYGADPNIHGHRPDFFKTPLHRARTKKVVKTLLKFGADPYAHASSLGLGRDNCLTVLDTLLMKNPDSALEVLNCGIQTNGQELDSADLQIVYDFELFFKEGLKESSYQDTKVDELATLRKIADYSPDLLQNPLAEGFLNIKWQIWKVPVYANVIMTALFVLFLSVLVVFETRLSLCEDNSALLPNNCRLNETSLTISSTIKNAFENDLVLDGVCLICSYCLTWLFLLYLIFRESIEAKYFPKFFQSGENLLDLFVILTTLCYLVLLLVQPLKISAFFGPTAVFIGLLDMTLMMGRIPSYGNHIFLLFKILKSLFKFFTLFLPFLMGFAVVFRSLMATEVENGTTEFTNIFYAFLKVTSMMLGDLDFRESFMPHIENNVYEKPGTAFIYIFYFLYVMIMSIVMVNLLIGLTVSKTEELSKVAEIIRLEKMVNQLDNAENLFRNFLVKFRPTFNSRKYNGQVFRYLKYSLQSKDASPWKVCILPFSREEHSKRNSVARKVSSFHTDNDLTVINDRNYSIYVYDDKLSKYTAKLPFKMPYGVVKATLSYLRDKKNDETRKHKQVLERELSNYMDNKDFYDLKRNRASFKPLIKKISKPKMQAISEDYSKDFDKVNETIENLESKFNEASEQLFEANQQVEHKVNEANQHFETKFDDLSDKVDKLHERIEALSKNIEERKSQSITDEVIERFEAKLEAAILATKEVKMQEATQL